MEAAAVSLCAERYGRVQMGTCGVLRFTYQTDEYGDMTKYFDAAGTLVALRDRDDAVELVCDDPPYGFVPDCQRTVTRDICAERRNASAAR
jgi:hypothetical protein